MWLLAAFMTSICFGVNNVIFKWSLGNRHSRLHIQFFFYLAAFLLTLGFGLLSGPLHLNIATILLGALIGILNANGNIQMSKAFEKGPASLTSPLISANAIFPVLSAGLIFHEQISVLQWIGILVMLVSALVIQYVPNTDLKADYLPWIFRILLAVVSFGALGVLMKVSSSLHMSSLNILISMYGGGCVYLWILSSLAGEKKQIAEAKVGTLVGFISILGYSSYFFALKSGIARLSFQSSA